MPEEANPDTAPKGAVGTKTDTRPKPTPEPPSLLPPWKVILHNDDKNYLEEVVLLVRRLTPLSERDAILRAQEAHRAGCALLLVTHQERAELYVDQFASCGLTVTTEPDA